MAEHRATSGIDLHLEPAGPGLRRGLTDALREAVRTGRLAPGTRLPSSRSLAADLGIARNTVADAYGDLVAEGWLTARQGSGTRVAERSVVRPAREAAPPRREPARPAYDLVPGRPDLASFPRAAWLKAARRALARAPHEALGYGDPRGRPELRTALADYLSRARGVRADPERIVICSGFSDGLTLLGAVLRRRGLRSVAVESYGLDTHWNLLHRSGLRTSPLPFDGLGTDTRDMTGARAVLLTPAHQFPMGVPLHPDRRAAVVAWARRTGGLVLDDDYDGEFRYDRQPVGALQGLDPDRVIYLGTASKSLAPGLRIAWMVLPEELVDEVATGKGAVVDWMCGTPDQLLREHHPGDPQPGGEGLARGAEVDHPVRVEALEGADRLPVVAELAVVVVLQDEAAGGPCPVDDRRPPVRGQRAAERELVGGRQQHRVRGERGQGVDARGTRVEGQRRGGEPGLAQQSGVVAEAVRLHGRGPGAAPAQGAGYQHQAVREPRADHDPFGPGVDAPGAGQVLGEDGPQLLPAARVAVPEGVDRGGVDRPAGRGEPGGAREQRRVRVAGAQVVARRLRLTGRRRRGRGLDDP